MFRHYKAAVFFLLVALVNVHFLVMPTAALAEDVQAGVVVSRQVRASNPNCQLAKAMAEMVGIGLALGIGFFIAAYPINFIPIVGPGLSQTLIIAGIATLVGVVLGTPMYFACYWSFVRHPVLRFDINDGSGNEAGGYKTCENPKPDYPSCANKEYRNEDDYFKCIANGVPGCKSGDIECGRRSEPTCPDKMFVPVSGYHWPKNRISSSDYIEFCYRLPLGSGLVPIALMAYIVMTETRGGPDAYFLGNAGVPNGGHFREADYGDGNIKRGKAYIRGPVECSKKPMRANQKEMIHGMTFKAVERSDKLCIDAWGFGAVPWFPQPEVGCHMRPAGPPAPMCVKSKPITEDGKIVSYDNTDCFNCYIASSCYGETSLAVKSLFPVTSVIVQCIRESFDNLLSGKTCTDKDGFLLVAQKRLAKAVNAALVLALILFAIKAALGGVQNSAEVYILGLKFAFVLYLTTGDAMTQYYRYLTDISVGLSDLVLEVGGNQTICDYRQDEYMSEDGKNMGYLAPWDKLDCRMMFYFGSQLNGSTAGTLLATVNAAAFVVAMIFYGLQVMICLMALLMVVMIILIVVWMMYLFILSFIAITILCLLSPLFLPMMLFQATKGYFDGWIRELITYTLYPVILFAFLSLIFSVFDTLYFGDLEFERKVVKVLDVNRITFVVKPEDACKRPENQTNLACMMTNATYVDKPAFFGLRLSTMEFGQDSVEIWTKLGMMALMGFLFYHFLHIIGSLAAELAGNPRADLSQGVTSPHSMMGKAMTGASKARNFLDSAIKHGAEKMKSSGGSDTKSRDEVGAAGAAGEAASGGGSGDSGGNK